MSVRWTGEPADSLPWWLARELSVVEGTMLVRCFAMVTAVLADELELPAGALSGLLRAAVDDYGRADGPVGVGPGLRSLYNAVRVAFG